MDELILSNHQDFQHSNSGLERIDALVNPLFTDVTELSLQKRFVLVGETSFDPSQYQANTKSAIDFIPGSVVQIITTVYRAIDSTKDILTGLANNPQLDNIMGVAFGFDYNHVTADNLLNQFAQNNFTQAPHIELVSGQNFNGAYAKENNTIYLSQEFVADNVDNFEAIKGVLLEEFGHYLDSQINVQDAAGDEGDIFSRLVWGQSISHEELSALKIEDDHAKIFLNEKIIFIEQQLIRGDSGNNTSYGTKDSDQIYGYNGNDSLYGNDGKDSIYGGGNDDKLWGGNNDDKLWGEDGSDELRGDDGNDELRGGGNDDKLWGGNQDDKLWGEDGNDQLVGDSGNDELNGGNGDDKIWGSGNDDKLWGEKGNDQLNGDDGNDILYGYGFSSTERDTLSGGNGSDRFILGDASNIFYDKSKNSDYAVITDFIRGEDVIHLKKLGFTKSNSNQAYGYRLVTVGSNTQICVDGSNELVALLQGVTGLSLTGKEFYFEGGNSSPTIYEHANFGGRIKTLEAREYTNLFFDTASGGNWNDFISSIDIPEGWIVEGYADINFSGQKVIFDSSKSYVGNDWNDKISSLKVYQVPTFYEHDKFGGNVLTLAPGDYSSLLSLSNGSGGNWNDFISSIEIPKGWIVEGYEHINFGGQKYVFDSSKSYVGNDSNDKITSLKIYQAPTIYQHANFGGNAKTLAAGEYSSLLNFSNGSEGNWNDFISSIEIPKGWVVEGYEHINFGGQKVVLNSSTLYVGNDWNDRISSLKIYAGYYRELSTLSDADWKYQSRDNLFFDGNTQNGESLTSVKQIYSDLSNGIFGSYKAMTAGYFDTTNYSGTHYGIDMAGLAGNQVKTVVGGKTRIIGPTTGNFFIGVEGDDGNLWIYGHLENYSVDIGKRVEAGTIIGTVFDGAYLNPDKKTGWMNQHLHLEVHKGHTYNRDNSISPIQAYWKLRNR
ncbi:peptidoglycan DD-metalloendopeptidase family protein [Calothrix sp. FACHB-1219]|uniref:peptidoglycan DD-metalloendopeptidase family protein n=1 Tax=unclassified Calothrix TaxID=2619626 RepID=UPI0016897617|nr:MULTISPECIES: peptidoglycan DD-metalloendopeptidase family protein [unclassified Calothrix]MBD2203612.1 peptidoglycan DD-metalloendopeptidase family protein [Calothrix sp. FACHB-168]MBD2219918.1 peptidoglycan DD-metalloendopeptidase family protein [Calothrix sp. FACHB-1219]